MPELPEVETIVRALRQGGRGGDPLPGKTIRSATLFWPGALASPTWRELENALPGQTVRDVTRRGKFILVHLDRHTLLIHLRMSGDLRVEPDSADQPFQPHDRAAISFVDGMRLVFNDTRKFGRLWLTDDPGGLLGGLGPEPLDETLAPARFHAMLQARRTRLKALLLDQSFLAGLGNIYSDEALHRARLHPCRPACSLGRSEADRLLAAVRQTLREGIRLNGASIDWAYRGGGFQNNFRVYGRTSQPCPRCKRPIERILVSQRSTHYCPFCQPFEIER